MGIYSGQFAELGEGKKNQPLKKEGQKISQWNNDKKGLKGKRGKMRGKNREERKAVGKKREAVGKRGIIYIKLGASY